MAEKEAFCQLLLQYRQGQYSMGMTVSGYCDEPTDCHRCFLLKHEISLHPPGFTNWVCPACLTEVVKKMKQKNMYVKLTGHYSEGQCQYIGCRRIAREEPGESGVIQLPKGYSRFLQLIIGDINK